MEKLLLEFEKLCERGRLGVPWSLHFPGTSEHSYHLVLGFLVHGNEWGTLPAALRLARDLASGTIRSGGPVTIFLGNPEATRRGQRYIDEDLNRVFTFDQRAHNRERLRADELRPLLDTADLFLDFHQTQTDTSSPFWTFPWDDTLADWAQIIGVAPLVLTRAPGGIFSSGKCCLDEYVRARAKVGITAELGSKGPDQEQVETCYQGVMRLIAAIQELQSGQRTLKDLSALAPPLTWFETGQIVVPKSSEDRLRPGLCNWTPVQKGEELSAPGAPLIRAEKDGRVLFPKYPQPDETLPGELLRLGIPIEDPRHHFETKTTKS